MSLPPPWDRLRWLADDRFAVGGTTFDLVSWGSPRKHSTPDRMVLVKDPTFAASMARILAGHRVRRMVEIGLYHGAGLALFDRLYAPDRLLGLDDRPAVPEALAGYVAAHDAADRITAIPGVDQGDAAQMTALMERHVPGRDLDLAIDDASHLYGATRTAFEVVFAYLRPGGIYLIEDWGWAHWHGVFDGPPPFAGPPLSRLILELTVAQAAAPGLIARLDIDWHHAAIVRGTAPIDGRLRLAALSTHAVDLRPIAPAGAPARA